MRVRAALGIGAAIGAAGGLVGSVAYNRAGEQSTARAALINSAYTPSLVALGALPVAGALAIRGKSRHASALVGAAAGGALIGTGIGTAPARIFSPAEVGTPHATLPDPDPAWVDAAVAASLADIDMEAEQIIIWAPGTMRKKLPAPFRTAVHQLFDMDTTSLSKLPTWKSYDVRQGAANYAAVLEQVLAEVRRRAPEARVLLAGESAGAYGIGELAADDATRPLFDRAVIWGHPGMAEYQYDDLHDVDVLEIHDEYDTVVSRFDGDQDRMANAAAQLMSGKPWELWNFPAPLYNNWWEASLLLRTGARRPLPNGYGLDPHNYREHMGTAAALLALQSRAEVAGSASATAAS